MYKAIAVLETRLVTEVAPTGYPGIIIYENYAVAYGNTPGDALNIVLLDNDKHVKEVFVVWQPNRQSPIE